MHSLSLYSSPFLFFHILYPSLRFSPSQVPSLSFSPRLARTSAICFGVINKLSLSKRAAEADGGGARARAPRTEGERNKSAAADSYRALFSDRALFRKELGGTGEAVIVFRDWLSALWLETSRVLVSIRIMS